MNIYKERQFTIKNKKDRETFIQTIDDIYSEYSKELNERQNENNFESFSGGFVVGILFSLTVWAMLFFITK